MTFTSEDIGILIEDISILFEILIKNNVKNNHQPDFEENIYTDIFDILKTQLSISDSDYVTMTKLENVIKYVLNNYCYKYISPKRAIPVKIPEPLSENVIEKLNDKIKYLENIPQPEQRTDEWYIFRHGLITASNAWKCFGSQSQRNSIIYEKCKPLVLNTETEQKNTSESNSSYVNTQTTLHFGQKYEPLSVMYYEYIYRTRVGEFGCIPHPKYSFLGASPDGINIDSESSLFGVMLEIKNICNREITGNPKLEYWVQTQLQMETCDLNKCHFLETRFIEYACKEDFEKDGTFQKTEDGKYKGIILHYKGEGKPHYEYCPFNCTKEDYDKWESEMFEKNKDLELLEYLYWKLAEVSCVNIVRNKRWFNEVIKDISEIWDIILKERETGYEHRMPKRRRVESKKIEDCIDISVVKKPSKCLINTSTL